jgi:GT2 family glycosyltransferase
VTAVDVVVLTWNDPELAAIAVTSALESDGVEVSVTVVDNGSDPPFRWDGDRVDVIRNEANRGVAPARNQGVRAGTAPFVCLLDSDARLHPGGLAALVQPFAADPSIGLCAPTFTDQPPEASAGRAPSIVQKVRRGLDASALYVPTPRTADAPWWDVEFAIGACQVFRRSAFADVGGLDDTIFYGPEDVDFCLRLGAKGWRIVQLATAVCDHPPRRSNRRLLSRRGLDHALALAKHYWRHRSGARGR